MAETTGLVKRNLFQKVFKNSEFGEVEVLVLNGEVLFNANHVAEILGIRNPREVLRHWDERYRKVLKNSDVYTTDTRKFNNSGETFLTEAGLYKLIFKSRKPNAEKFQDWVFTEVLPDIRKYGFYGTDQFIEKALNNPDFIIEILTKYKEERQRRLKEEKKRIEAEKTIAILTHVKKLYTTTEIAKELGLKSARQLNEILHKKGIQFKQNGTWVLYSDYADLGYESIKQEVLDSGKVIYHRKWTHRGREFILDLFNKKIKGGNLYVG